MLSPGRPGQTDKDKSEMDCKHANEHLVDYLYQELDADEADRIEGHLRQCEGCSDELASFESTRRLMQKLPLLEPSPSVTELLLKEAARAVQPEAPGFWQRLRAGMRLLVLNPAMTAAAVLVLVLGVSFYAYRQTSPPPSDGELPVPDEIGEPAPVGGPAPATAAKAPQVAQTNLDRQEAKQQKEAEGRAGAAVGDKVVLAQPAREPAADMPKGKHALTLDGTRPKTVAKRRVGRRPAARAKPRPTLRYRKGPKRANEAFDDLDSNALGALGGGGGKRDGHKKSGKLASGTESAPRPAPAPAAQAEEKERSSAASAWLAQARKASKVGKCEQALRLYHRALEEDPGLRRTVGPEVRRCAARIGLDGLAKAQKQLPLLAGWLEAEMSEARRREANQQRAARKKAKPAKPKAVPQAPAQRRSYSSPSAD